MLQQPICKPMQHGKKQPMYSHEEIPSGFHLLSKRQPFRPHAELLLFLVFFSHSPAFTTFADLKVTDCKISCFGLSGVSSWRHSPGCSVWSYSLNPTRHPAQPPLIPATQLAPLRPAWSFLTCKEARKGKGRVREGERKVKKEAWMSRDGERREEA